MSIHTGKAILKKNHFKTVQITLTSNMWASRFIIIDNLLRLCPKNNSVEVWGLHTLLSFSVNKCTLQSSPPHAITGTKGKKKILTSIDFKCSSYKHVMGTDKLISWRVLFWNKIKFSHLRHKEKYGSNWGEFLIGSWELRGYFQFSWLKLPWFL